MVRYVPCILDSVDSSRVEMKCSCGMEFQPLEKYGGACPKCSGEAVSASLDKGSWRPMSAWYAEAYQKALEPGGLDFIPAADRAETRQNVIERLRALEMKEGAF